MRAQLAAWIALTVGCGASSPSPPTTPRPPAPEPTVEAANEEVDAAPYVAAVLDELEEQLLVRPSVLGAQAATYGSEVRVVMVIAHDRADVARAGEEAAGTLEETEALAAEEEEGCFAAADARNAEAYALYEEASAAYEADPSERNERRVMEATMDVESAEAETADCGSFTGFPEGTDSRLVIAGGARVDPTTMEILEERELEGAPLPIEDVEVALRDLNQDGVLEFSVLYRATLESQETSGGYREVESAVARFLVFDQDGEPMLDENPWEGSGQDPPTLYRAFFEDVDGDGHDDLVLTHWMLIDRGCTAHEASLPARFQRALAETPSERLVYQAWSPGPDNAVGHECEEVLDDRAVRRFDPSERRYVSHHEE